MGILKGRTALVTGGASGIGAAIAIELADDGADVAIVDLHTEECIPVQARIDSLGRKSLAIAADVSSFEAAQKAVDKVIVEFGKLDLLVCNAGITADAVIWKMSEAHWDRVLDVNLKGYFNYIKAAAPVMREQKWGRIVCITSINGLRGKFGQSNYSASKAGVIGLVKSAAKELGRSGITVNAVAPGMILTEMMGGLPEEVKQRALEETAVGRLGVPEDVAHMVSFLCSDFARHVTGEVIKVDGGQYI
jgi:3-oxoacyl-[acyl-carrier protein] reductase